SLGSTAEATVSAMASAGGRARSSVPAYIPATGSTALVDGLREIFAPAGTGSCTFAVGSPTDGGARAGIILEGDGTPIPRDVDRTDGWDFTDPSDAALQIYGPRCEAILSGALRTLAVRSPCDGP